MNKQKNTIRFIYSGTMLVLNNSERYALASYFYKRNLILSVSFVVYRDEIFYRIENDISKELLIEKGKLAA